MSFELSYGSTNRLYPILVYHNTGPLYLKDYPSIARLTLCLDNDEAGRFASEHLKNKYQDRYEIRCHIPRAKDWNEELVNFRIALETEVTVQSRTIYEKADEHAI